MAVERAPRVSAEALAGTTRQRYFIAGMDCPTEEGLLRKQLQGKDGLVALEFDLINRLLDVHHRLPDDAPLRELRVDNQSSTAVTVQFGSTEFGAVAAGAATDYEPFETGELELRFDGRLVDTEQLASDNVGGRWDLTVLSADPSNLGYGFTAAD